MYIAHPFALGAGAIFILAALVIYRRRGREDARHGSQTAVLMLVVGAIMAIYGLGLMEYRPSDGEINRAAARRAQ